MTATGRRAIVVAATPTSNGDLHIGHMAGPYLAADIYSRYLAGTGREVIYTTCTDDSQSYVVTTARRLGTTPERLSAESAQAIGRSAAAMGLSLAGLPPVGERYRATVVDFFTALHAAGRLRLRTVRLPYDQRSGSYLYDAMLTGDCPVCLAASSGGVCEGCGHPNNYDELLSPRSALDPAAPVSYREHDILVLEMESYRDRLTSYFAAHGGNWRPHGRQLIADLLARPLPAIPITFPARWGIAAPFPQTPGQVFYPWVEAMPAVMYSTWWTAAQQGGAATQVDEYWRAGQGSDLVFFHGFDNVYHWGLMDLVLLMAHGERYILPAGHVCNEFYNLDGDKFSTSRNHLIRCADLLADVPRDLVRFYLCLTAPETERTNFTVGGLRETTARRLTGPWNHLSDLLRSAVDRAGPESLPVSAAGLDRARAIISAIRACYELPTFSPAAAAGKILRLTGELARDAGTLAEPGQHPAAARGDLLLAVRALLSCAAPILIDTAAEAEAAGLALGPAGQPPAPVSKFRLPRLPSLAGALSTGG